MRLLIRAEQGCTTAQPDQERPPLRREAIIEEEICNAGGGDARRTKPRERERKAERAGPSGAATTVRPDTARATYARS